VSPSRIDELRRRVQSDPASIAFAQLAEEYRRSGQTDEAVRVCREGLTRHPGYLSARVTLGRALLALGQLDEAQAELEFVVAEAPENLAAVRGLAEIFQRGGNFPEALTYYRRALTLARHDPEIEEIVQQLSRQVGVAASGASQGLSFEEAHRELLSAAERVPVAPPAPPRQIEASAPAGPGGATAPFDFDRLVAALGTPAAPAHLEAVVQGQPSLTSAELVHRQADLPPAADDPTNPFAALEAELRAQDAPPAGVGQAPGMLGLPDLSSWTPSLPDAPGPAATPSDFLEAALPEGTASVDLDRAFAGVDDERHVVAEPATIAADWSGLLELPVAAGGAPPAAEERLEPVAAPHVAAAASSEDVLGDLENWLDTLHDRTNS
jgi:Tetratricopeptide repeat